MTEKQEEAIKAINLQLESIKVLLNAYWEEIEENDEDKDKNKYTLHIEDPRSTTTSNRTEDIELKIRSLRLSKK